MREMSNSLDGLSGGAICIEMLLASALELQPFGQRSTRIWMRWRNFLLEFDGSLFVQPGKLRCAGGAACPESFP